MSLNKNKVVLGLSGGVDSSTAALFLMEKGYDVTGLFFDVTGGNEEGKNQAQQVASELGIDFIYKDMSIPFSEIVIKDFCDEYKRGRTPSPCIRCNPRIKFKVLIDAADDIGAYYIATGHYAGISHDNEHSAWFIKTACNIKKDQSYMLYRLQQQVIMRMILPLQDIESKSYIREKAKGSGLSSYQQKDSQEICFIDGDYKDFLTNNCIKNIPGDFIDSSGKTIGQHSGIVNYTIGQRKGLGVTFGKPMFVTEIDSERNTVRLGSNEELFKDEVIASDGFFSLSGCNKLPEEYEKMHVLAKIRYAAKPAEATISSMKKDGATNLIVTHFKEKQRAVTPGQSIVFYKDDLVIGGGIIE